MYISNILSHYMHLKGHIFKEFIKTLTLNFRSLIYSGIILKFLGANVNGKIKIQFVHRDTILWVATLFHYTNKTINFIVKRSEGCIFVSKGDPRNPRTLIPQYQQWFLQYLDIYSGNMAPPKELDGVLLFVQLVVILGRIITSVPVKHKLPVVQPTDPTLLLHDSQVSFLT